MSKASSGTRENPARPTAFAALLALGAVMAMVSVGPLDAHAQLEHDWTFQNIGKDHLTGVHFADAETGWAVGHSGTILRTTDGGSTWESRTVDADYLRGIHFVDNKTGWAVGGSGAILRTTDGGTAWESRTVGTSGLFDVYFADRNTGWIAGKNGTILRTTDGGDTWESRTVGTSGLAGIHFVDRSTGWAVGGSGTILRTTDGGDTWESRTVGMHNLTGIHFVDRSTGWAVGLFGAILRTTDGGDTWESQAVGTSGLFDVYFADRNTGWIVGENHTLLHTVDGGETWLHARNVDWPHPVNPDYLHNIHFVDNKTGWAVGLFGTILHTTDGGTMWESQTVGRDDLEDVHFVDSETGWITGDNGIIYNITDGGNTWTSRYVDAADIRVYFVDSEKGWLVGSDGYLRHTTDGGTTWEPYAVDADYLDSIHFVDNETGWAVGGSGTILRTTDGGTTWESRTTDVDSISDMYFVDHDTGWIIGSKRAETRDVDGNIHHTYESTILRTTDGGTTWESRTTDVDSISDMYFVDHDTGWIIGSKRAETRDVDGNIHHTYESTVLRTTDGGTTWESQTVSMPRLYTVYFVNHNIGWILGGGNSVIRDSLLHTTDGGTTWMPYAEITSQLYDIHFVDSNTGWAVGEHGAVYKTAPAQPTTVSKVTSYAINDTYGAGDIINIQVVFSGAVTVLGEPYLELETGGHDSKAAYSDGSGTSTLFFTYEVRPGDASEDLDYAGMGALALNGGAMRDDEGRDVTLALPEPGNMGSLGANKEIIIDTGMHSDTDQSVPHGLAAYHYAVTTSSVPLAWHPPVHDADCPVTDYAIQYRKAPAGLWVIFDDGVSTGTYNTAVTGLLPDTEYQFRVAAADCDGKTPHSATASATTEHVQDSDGANDPRFLVAKGRITLEDIQKMPNPTGFWTPVTRDEAETAIFPRLAGSVGDTPVLPGFVDEYGWLEYDTELGNQFYMRPDSSGLVSDMRYYVNDDVDYVDHGEFIIPFMENAGFVIDRLSYSRFEHSTIYAPGLGTMQINGHEYPVDLSATGSDHQRISFGGWSNAPIMSEYVMPRQTAIQLAYDFAAKHAHLYDDAKCQFELFDWGDPQIRTRSLYANAGVPIYSVYVGMCHTGNAEAQPFVSLWSIDGVTGEVAWPNIQSEYLIEDWFDGLDIPEWAKAKDVD